MPKGIRLTEQEVIKRILTAFPDKNVTDISSFFKNNNSVLRFIKRKADEKNISTDDYLKKLGFKVYHSRNYTHFLKRLEMDFPDKVINKNLTSLDYYTNINNFCNSLNIPLKKFLKKIGYKIQKNKKTKVYYSVNKKHLKEKKMKTELKDIQKEIAREIFQHYASCRLPEEIFSKITEEHAYSMYDHKYVDSGFLLNENEYSICYEVSLSQPDEEEKEDFGIEDSYCVSYIFIDKTSQTMCDINGLFDNFSVDSGFTLEKALTDAKENYLEKIKSDIQFQLEMYNQEKILEYDVKKSSKNKIKEAKHMIKTLFPDLFFKIPKEIFLEKGD